MYSVNPDEDRKVCSIWRSPNVEDQAVLIAIDSWGSFTAVAGLRANRSIIRAGQDITPVDSRRLRRLPSEVA